MVSVFALLLITSTCALFPIAVLGAASLDKIIAPILEEYSGVGLTAWSVNGLGNLCSLGAAGERIKDSGEPFVSTGDSRHHIGSNTKSMVATLLAILIEDGTIGESGWETSLSALLPVAQGTSYENVTLRELMGHLSGIASEPTNETVIPDLTSTDIRVNRMAVAKATLLTPPASTPGTEYLYSNYGYLLAGTIIEELTNATWDEALAERLFLPLGINLGKNPSAWDGAPDNDVDPWGHSGNGQIPCNPSVDENLCENSLWWGPAGRFSGPIAAMARYLSWHVQCHNGAIPDGDLSSSLLSQESCQKLHQPVNASISLYGYGWGCYEQDGAGGLVCSHNGGNNLNY
jgi:D-alanyl-D-alanine carboxypeptidase